MSAHISILQHFKKLFDFAGREDRASFWPYAAVALLIIMVAGTIVFVPMMSRSLQAMQQFAAQHPDQATVTSGSGQYSISIEGPHAEFMPAGSMALFLVVTFGLAMLLYAAAVARRLHDRGKSGLWGLMPLPFVLTPQSKCRDFSLPWGPVPSLIWQCSSLFSLAICSTWWLYFG